MAFEREKEIRGLLDKKQTGVKTVAHAIEQYMDNGGEDRYLKQILQQLGKLPLTSINQEVIDKAARAAYPGYQRQKGGKVYKHSKSTIKRQFYVPLAAILHYAHDLDWMPYIRIKMPKTKRPAPKWANKEWFSKFNAEAEDELKAIVAFLAGTGSRISEALNLRPADVNLNTQEAYLRTTKNGDPRMAYLPDFVIEAIKPYMDREKVFSFIDRHAVNKRLKKTAERAGIEYLSSHKVGSHTFATNLAKYRGMDAKALTATGRWKDPKSTYHYTHYLSQEQAKNADSLGELFKD